MFLSRMERIGCGLVGLTLLVSGLNILHSVVGAPWFIFGTGAAVGLILLVCALVARD